MNLQQLEYIVALDRTKSFSKAADACFVTQATLSTMVKKLEEELEMVMFDRKASPIITTDCGKRIVEEAKKILYHTGHLKQIASDMKGKIEGELRLGIIPTIAGNLLHRILPVLMKKYPLLKLNIQEITTENVVSLIKNRELDAGIVSTPLSIEEMEEEILYYEKLMVYGHVQHSKTKYIRPNDMINEKMWLLEQGNCLTDQVTKLCSLSPKQLHHNLQFSPNTFDSLLNIVDQMKGLTVIPELYYQDLPAQRKKNIRDFKSPYPVREVSMIYHRPFAKIRLIEAVSDEIKSLIPPRLQTQHLKNREMMIAGIGS